MSNLLNSLGGNKILSVSRLIVLQIWILLAELDDDDDARRTLELLLHSEAMVHPPVTISHI